MVAEVWVYQGTAITYLDIVDINSLTNVKKGKNGMGVAGKLTDASRQAIQL
ncbi:hypothetical protein ACQUW5_04500 [Legionella sp. CNM-1927-20]|uniref:hypothetical protein n=1 Tax=Legionella sp. CNM-1927-20 TaxID=3422221 RepID=UPI00403AAC84